MILTDFDKHTKFNDIRCLKIPFPVTKLIQKSYNCNFKSTGRCIWISLHDHKICETFSTFKKFSIYFLLIYLHITASESVSYMACELQKYNRKS